MHPTLKPLAFTLCLLLSLYVASGCRPAEPLRPSNTTHTPASSNETTPAAELASPEDSSNDAVADESPQVGDTPSETADTSKPSAEEAPEKTSKTPKTQPTSTETKRPVPKPQPGKTLDLTFDDIKFDIEPDAPFKREMLPQAIEDLGGQKIRIGGYMLPSFQQRDIKQFVLVRDNMECCFGPGAALYDCILIEMDGRGVDFTVRPVTVEGTFTVKEYKSDDGKHLAIYHMQGTGVR